MGCLGVFRVLGLQGLELRVLRLFGFRVDGSGSVGLYAVGVFGNVFRV